MLTCFFTNLTPRRYIASRSQSNTACPLAPTKAIDWSSHGIGSTTTNGAYTHTHTHTSTTMLGLIPSLPVCSMTIIYQASTINLIQSRSRQVGLSRWCIVCYRNEQWVVDYYDSTNSVGRQSMSQDGIGNTYAPVPTLTTEEKENERLMPLFSSSFHRFHQAERNNKPTNQPTNQANGR